MRLAHRLATLPLQWRLSLSLGTVVSLGIIAILLSSYRAHLAQTLASEAAELGVLKQAARLAVRSEVGMARAAAVAIATDKDVRRLFAEGQRDALAEKLADTWKPMKQDGANQGQFHLPPATSFLRLHKVAEYGDDLSAYRKTVLMANQEHRIVDGLETGKFGVGFRYVLPVQWDGVHVGTFEIGRSLDGTILDDLNTATGDTWSVHPIASAVEAGLLWDAVASSAGTSAFEAELALSVKAEDSLRTNRDFYLDRRLAGGHHYAVVAVPLTDYSGEVTG